MKPKTENSEPACRDAAPDAPESGSEQSPAEAEAPREIGGRDGPDPTRYGDWEKNGRCIDF